MLSKLSLGTTFRMIVQPNKIFIEKYEKYNALFSPLADIQECDKLGKCDNKYYVQKNGYSQKLSRWWWNEDRTKTFTDIDTDFSNFFKFCDELKADKHKGWTNNSTVCNSMIELVSKIIPGLYNLKKTYSDCDKDSDGNKLCLKIDSIIFTLIDFKTEINKPTLSSSPRHRTLSF
jgi:hypothetical protein